MNGNSITLVGNCVEAPELRSTQSGQYITTLRVAVNRRWQDRSSGEWHEDTSFFSCVCWRELAQNVAESVKRGDRVVVTGRLEQRQWTTPDGDKRSQVEVQVDECGLSLRWAVGSVERTQRRDDVATTAA